MHRAGPIFGAASNLDLAPTGLAAQRQDGAGLKDIAPAAAIGRIILAVIETDDFRAAQASGKTYQQDRPVT